MGNTDDSAGGASSRAPARSPSAPRAVPPPAPPPAPWCSEDVELFRRTVRHFVQEAFVPVQARWRKDGHPGREAWTQAGQAGLLLPEVPEAYGGGGGSVAHEIVVLEELARAGVRFGSSVQSIVARYLVAYGSEEQKRAWLPRMARGELVAAIAMTEPGAGSDLQAIRMTARREGAEYVLDGAKTFITNGWLAGLVCLAVKTDPRAPGPKGISLVCAEPRELQGYTVRPPVEKLGRHGQDVCELCFEGVRVPAANLLGPAEGRGFFQMMEQLPYERLGLAASAVATAEEALRLTVQYAKDRAAFGKPLLELQNTRMKLAECRTAAQVTRVFVDHCVSASLAGKLDPVTTAMAKYWATEQECRILDECVQIHGGYGYMAEYLVARMWADARVERIYGGANELMKELIAWSL
jgi:acyl-CoA dehydrogenase